MKKLKKIAFIGLTAATVVSCKPGIKTYASYEDYPLRYGNLIEMLYTPEQTTFMVWAPTASEVGVRLYETGQGGYAYDFIKMKPGQDGTWQAEVKKDLLGKFYTFDVKVGDTWLGETPGINARAVGVNGDRGAIIDMKATNPEGWEDDIRPELLSTADMIIYELHYRDISMHKSSGITHKGKYLSLTENRTLVPSTYYTTGIDHLKELGITHVHLLPSFDYASIDEAHLEKEKYNWGYDPKNYNVPEGSYSTDPYDPYIRIREFKQMVQALHQAGIRVIMDVVYNHTYNTDDSPFERTAPGYFYRQNADGTFADASACGNEIASDRAMMRKYMIESILYWIDEYHIDGFRFDLMGIHDIKTMNEIREAVNEVDPTICMYGEGWAARAPQYPAKKLAMKGYASQMPGIAVFSDELRDAVRGPVMKDKKGGFLTGVSGNEESIKFGIAGAVYHPQVDYSKVIYTDSAWAAQPTQMISYASSHDDLCLVDRLKSTMPAITAEELIRLDKLAQTTVFTSQGIPFIFAGEEVMRDKKGVHNSYKSSDQINAIDWRNKETYNDVYEYYRGLIRLRKNHPAFRMGDADLIRKHLEFLPVTQKNVVAFQLKDYANGDSWENIIVILNSSKKSVKVDIPKGTYVPVCYDGKIDESNLKQVSGTSITVPKQSAMIIRQ
ncbi:MAG: type I pullulanase [Bacteroides sp.]|nr:type I pullulanase [Bacteroides sp.]